MYANLWHSVKWRPQISETEYFVSNKNQIANFPNYRNQNWMKLAIFTIINEVDNERHILSKYFYDEEYSPYSNRHFGYYNKMKEHTMLSICTSVVMRGLISKRCTWWMLCRINSLAWMRRLSFTTSRGC